MNEQQIIDYLHLDGNSVNNSPIARALLQYCVSVTETSNALSDHNAALQSELDEANKKIAALTTQVKQ